MKKFVSESAFKSRVNYFGDWKRVEPFEQVAIDLDIIPMIGYKNTEYLVQFVDASNFPNSQLQTLFDAYILDLTVYFTAFRAYPIIYRHINNAGITTAGENPVTLEEMQAAQNYYMNLANTLQQSMFEYYCRNQALLSLPEPLPNVDSAPITGANLNIDFGINTDPIPYKVVPVIDIDAPFYYGLINTGETLTLEIILQGVEVRAGDTVSWAPNNGFQEVWFASGIDYATWKVSNDAINTSTLEPLNGLFNKFLIGELITYRQQYISEMDAAVLTVKV